MIQPEKCPACGSGDFKMSGKGLHFEMQSERTMALMSHDDKMDMRIDCQTCKASYKPTMDGLKPIGIN